MGMLAAPSNKLSCPYCERPHYPDKCRTVTDPARRKAILVEKKRCFLCTKASHGVSDCQAKRMCVACGAKHHTSICTGEKNTTEDTEEKANEKADETCGCTVVGSKKDEVNNNIKFASTRGNRLATDCFGHCPESTHRRKCYSSNRVRLVQPADLYHVEVAAAIESSSYWYRAVECWRIWWALY